MFEVPMNPSSRDCWNGLCLPYRGWIVYALPLPLGIVETARKTVCTTLGSSSLACDIPIPCRVVETARETVRACLTEGIVHGIYTPSWFRLWLRDCRNGLYNARLFEPRWRITQKGRAEPVWILFNSREVLKEPTVPSLWEIETGYLLLLRLCLLQPALFFLGILEVLDYLAPYISVLFPQNPHV